MVFLTIVCTIIAVTYLSIIPDARGRGYPASISDFEETGWYRIDSDMILNHLERGNIDILTPVISTPEVYVRPLDEGSSFLWRFSDYVKIADIVKEEVWREDMNDLSIFRMYFYADCQEPMKGFSIGDFVYFKSISTQEGEKYTVREVLIRPLYGDVGWGGGTSYPRPLFGWKRISLEQIEISADDALKIAEENGGTEARLAVNNECTIFLTYNPNTSTNAWNLTIRHHDDRTIFEISIDPFNGKFKFLEPSR